MTDTSGRGAGVVPPTSGVEGSAEDLRQALATLQVAVDAGGLGTWSWDRATGRVRWSERLEAICGFEPGAFPGTFAAYVESIHPDDRAEAVARIEAATVALERFEHRYRIVRRDGEVRWLEGAGQPLVDADGRLTGMAGACADATDRVVAAQHDAAEVAVTRLLVEASADADVLLRLIQLLGTYLPLDVTNIWTPDPAGHMVLRHAWSARPSSVVDASRELVPEDELALPRRASAARGPVVVPDLHADVDLLRRPAALADGLRWAAAYPIIVSGQLEGVLECFGADPGPAPALSDTIGRICAQTGLFLGRARALDTMAATLAERARVAAVLQESLLPPVLPEVPHLDAAAHHQAGRELVGGDFYDLFPLAGGEWGVALGDVCGKGPEAASATALLRHSIRTAAILDPSPASVLDVANAALHQGGDDRFATAAYARLRPGPGATDVVLSSAGHPPALVVRADASVEAVPPSGRLLGVFDEIEATEQLVRLGAGDALVLYSDGIVEARGDGQLFGEERLAQVLAGHAGRPAAEVVDATTGAVDAFAGAGEADDRALVVLRVPIA